MKKKIYYDKNATKEFKDFRREVQREFQAHIEILGRKGRLEFPEAKKIAKNLFEIRVSEKEAYRGIYAYIWKEHVIILHFFQKKTRKTPIKDLKIAKERLKRYE
ncbi:type II toxin-antitoxin system RelE/ParE family toxin [Candidatus Microgenomates bacterium]|nr:type II toxin-antitoxin system RelE/ParE family toxin [Candidatus Microgenomates bacterium]